MSQPEPVLSSARAFCGDPDSHVKRGKLIRGFLNELGLKPEHRVLNIGCGALSEGAPLIRFLDPGNFVGSDPNQWLIRAALDAEPDLSARQPLFAFNSDFTTGRGPYDYVVCHSVLSHTAWWQTQMALMNVRREVNDGAVWLASLRLHVESSFDSEWQYPGNSFFSKEDITTIAYQCGWSLEHRGDLKGRLMAECPNDVHDWVVLRATLSPESANSWRLDMDTREREKREIRVLAQEEYAMREKQRLEEAE
jgi:hypothetical protein